jgi:hypothetical protein
MTPILRPGIKFLFCLLFFFSYAESFSQSRNYNEIQTSAFAAQEKKEYKTSASLFCDAFRIGKKNHSWDGYVSCYYAACAWNMAGYRDSAFLYLSRSIDAGLTAENAIFNKPELKGLFDNADTLSQFKNKVTAKQKEKEKYTGFIAHLAKMGQEDQGIRSEYSNALVASVKDSVTAKRIEARMYYSDSLRMVYLDHFLDSAGFVGPDLVGVESTITIYLVITHTRNRLLQEKYYTILKEHNCPGSTLCIIYDKMSIAKGKPQKYGTQLNFNWRKGCFELYPIENRNGVNALRAENELEPLEEYLKKFSYCN